MNPHFFQTMLERVRKGQPHTEHAIQSIQRLTDLGMTVTKMARTLEGDRNLTPTGARSKMAETIRTKTLAEFAQASRPVRKALSHTEAQRAGLTLPPVDRTDQVGEMRRKEIRDFLRSLPPQARRVRAEDLARHPEGQAAIFDAPDYLSGLDDASLGMPESRTFERMKSAAIHQIHGSRLAELDGIESDYQEVAQVAAMVRNELFEKSGMSREGFEAAIQPLEAAADA